MCSGTHFTHETRGPVRTLTRRDRLMSWLIFCMMLLRGRSMRSCLPHDGGTRQVMACSIVACSILLRLFAWCGVTRVNHSGEIHGFGLWIWSAGSSTVNHWATLVGFTSSHKVCFLAVEQIKVLHPRRVVRVVSEAPEVNTYGPYSSVKCVSLNTFQPSRFLVLVGKLTTMLLVLSHNVILNL